MATSTWRKDLRTRARAALKGATLEWSRAVRIDAGARAIMRALVRSHGGAIRVMKGRGTPSRDLAALRTQLQWVTRHFDVLAPQDFFDMLDRYRKPPERAAVVLTFDDGLASNYDTLAPLLESMGLRACFFVSPEFAQTQGEAARDYFLERVYPGWSGPLVEEDYRPMTPQQILDLSRRGHSIGNHTWSHARLKALAPWDEHREIRSSRDRLSEWLAAPCRAFAWTFGWDAIDPSVWRTASSTHRYILSCCTGMNWADELDRLLIWRSPIDASATLHEVRFAYSGLADPLWGRERRLLKRIRRRLTATEQPP